jgi:hypothetical protein
VPSEEPPSSVTIPPMTTLYVRLSPETFSALCEQAAHELRTPRQQATFLLTNALVQRRHPAVRALRCGKRQPPQEAEF